MLNETNRPGDGDTAASELRRTGFHAQVQHHAGNVMVRLHGELDMATSAALDRALSSAFDGGGGTSVVVDLASLTFMDSTGIAVLLGACRRAEEAGQSLVVRSPSRPVLKAFRLTGVDQILAIEPDEPLAN